MKTIHTITFALLALLALHTQAANVKSLPASGTLKLNSFTVFIFVK